MCFCSLFVNLKQKGICIMFVSHRLDEVLEVADRVTVLRDGRSLGTFPAREMNDRKLALLMTGKEFHYALREADLSDRPPCLSVASLTRAGEYAGYFVRTHAGRNSRRHRPARLGAHRAWRCRCSA